jgi:NADH pyrophosphatase NudC (nudix superfamily)
MITDHKHEIKEKGWYLLIYKMLGMLKRNDPKADLIDIREVFGVLEINARTDANGQMIVRLARDESMRVCQKCGTYENVGHIKDARNMTICINCYFEKVRPFEKIRGKWQPGTIYKPYYNFSK